MNVMPRFLFLFAVSAVLLSAFAKADEAAEKGRAVFESKKDAVVTVRAVVSLSSGEREKENHAWANGTVLDPGGLTVLSLSVVDPVALYRTMSEGASAMTAKVVSLHILLPNGDELPGEVVLRDEELDLVYVRPIVPPAQPMPFLSLDAIGHPQLLDEIAVISQLGEVVRRTHTVLLARIEGLIEKPRTYYIPGEDRGRAIVSSPAFTLDGAFVGMGAMRAIKQASQGGGGDNFLVVIISAQDIKAGMDQVPARSTTAPTSDASSAPVIPPAPATSEAPVVPAPIPAPVQP